MAELAGYKKAPLMHTRTRLSTPSLQLYTIAQEWQAEIRFFGIETSFIHRLIEDYLTEILTETQSQKLQITCKRLLNLEHHVHQSSRLIEQQLKELTLVSENLLPEDIAILTKRHEQLAHWLNDMTVEYRSTKMEMFALVAGVMHEFKLLAR